MSHLSEIFTHIENLAIKPIAEKVMKLRYDTIDDFDEVMNDMGIGRSDPKRIVFFEILQDSLVGKDILEIGIGSGYNIPYYKSVKSITGIDISENMLKKTYQRIIEERNLGDFPQAHLHLADNRPQKKYDTTILTYTLTGAGDPSKLFLEALDLTKKGGTIAILDSITNTTNNPRYNVLFFINAVFGVGYKESFQKIFLKNKKKFKIIRREKLKNPRFEDPYSGKMYSYILILEKKT